MTHQRILITGGSSGIGLAVAERLARAGASLALVARGEDALHEAAASLPGAPQPIAADVGDAAQASEAVNRAASSLGGLDAVVVGAAAATYGPFADLRSDEYLATIRTTLLGVLNTIHAALPHLERSGGTAVIVGSVAGRVPVPWMSAYTAAKHGVRGFARSLACELRARGSSVRLVLINPGPVDTPFWLRARTPDGRLPPEPSGAYRPEDVATEIERAIARPRALEQTFGGLLAAWVRADALAPNLAVRIMGPLAGLGWRRRDDRERQSADALGSPLTQARRRGGVLSRPSLLTRLRTGSR